jgi:chromosome segregation ATPase
MSMSKPRGEPTRNGQHGQAVAPAALVPEDGWGDEAALRQEVRRLTEENQQLLGLLASGDVAGELERLRAENAQLQNSVAEFEALLEGEGKSNAWAEQQREYEALLEEKSEVIRDLHQKIQELREQAEQAAHAAPRPKADADTPATEQELQEMMVALDQQRRQLEDDEEAVMSQMRQMEMSMARERAELARQRAELQRMHNELKHEIEQAARDGALRERLQHLQRRQPDGSARPSDPTPAPKSSGVLRRLFGSGQQG